MQNEGTSASVLVCARAEEPEGAQANVQVNAACCFVIVSFVLCEYENSVTVVGSCDDAVGHCHAAAGLRVVMRCNLHSFTLSSFL